MSAGTKLFIAIVIIIAAGVVVWHMGLLQNLFPQTAGVAPVATTTPQQATSTTAQNTTGLPTNPQDTSTQALGQDTAALDIQMQGLSNDSAALDQSLNDQPIQQSY